MSGPMEVSSTVRDLGESFPERWRFQWSETGKQSTGRPLADKGTSNLGTARSPVAHRLRFGSGIHHHCSTCQALQKVVIRDDFSTDGLARACNRTSYCFCISAISLVTRSVLLQLLILALHDSHTVLATRHGMTSVQRCQIRSRKVDMDLS
jgi:hypothetical protein